MAMVEQLDENQGGQWGWIETYDEEWRYQFQQEASQ